ncbi:immunoglobulin-like and fibronectin type III domain-containing protein 1 isoform X1 [Lepisosteus oculatus]|uniref:immunoglobulin-like and fibronectin type III domain-containing protein 1 isoform X1 n=1 Tax=Lepisosteus oculatus TaxID=7918 RepID=UPI00371E0C92
MKTSKITNGPASGQDHAQSYKTGSDAPVKKRAGIRKKSKIPGVMITQYTEDIPNGCSTPDFERKPIALTIQEGKTATFKAVVKGEPTPVVTWKRAKGNMDDPNKFKMTYDRFSNEYVLQVVQITGDEADTYKCYATNDYGEAVSTATLIVIEVGFKKKKKPQEQKESTVTKDPAEFRKLLRKRVKDEVKKEEKVIDGKVWDILLNADKKDYERICIEHGITDFRGMLKRLQEMKKEREEEQAKYLETISNLKHIEVNSEGLAEFELDMDLKDPSSRIFLYKDGIMIPYSKDMEMKHSLKQAGKKYIFCIKDLGPEDAGLYQVDVEEANVFSTELPFKFIPVQFLCQLQEVRAKEREDALFECVLSQPLFRAVWMGKNTPIENSDKYEITVSEDGLIHRLLVKDVMPVDKGIYSIVVGIKSSSAWLVVESDEDDSPSAHGKKKARKTTRAGGGGTMIESLAREQAEKLKKLWYKAEEETGAGQGNDPGPGVGSGTVAGAGAGLGAGTGAGISAGREAGKGAGIGAGSERGEGQGAGLGAGVCAGVGAGTGAGNQNLINGLDDNRGKGGVGQRMGGKGVLGVTEVGGDQSEGDGKRGKGELVDGMGNLGGGSGGLGGSGAGQGGLGEGEGDLQDSKVEQGGLADRQGGLGRKDRQLGHGQSEKGDLGDGSGAGKGCPGEEGGMGTGDWSGMDSGLEGARLSGNGRGEGGNSGLGGTRLVSGDDGRGLTDEQNRKKRHAGRGPLIEDTIVEPGVHFTCGLSDVHACKGHPAELVCKLSSDQSEGIWFKDGEKLSPKDGLSISKKGAIHKLILSNVQDSDAGKYKFEAEGRKTEAHIVVEDPPVLDKEELQMFSQPVTVKAGHNAVFKIPFEGREPFKVSWFRDGEELQDDVGVKVERGPKHSRLLLSKCQRKDSGDIKVKVKNESGAVEAMTRLVVLDKPTPPQGPVEVLESSPTRIGIKWRPPRDDGGSPVLSYSLERQQVGRNTWLKLGEVPGTTTTFATNQVEHGKRYSFRIRAHTAEGVSNVLETDDITAGTKAYSSPPAPPKVISATSKCITVSWVPPHNTGGSRITGYILEKRKKGSNIWSPVSDMPITEKKFTVRDIVEGQQYEFRVAAVNASGIGEPSVPSDFIFARDPMKPPGKVKDLKVTDSTYNSLSLSWAKPSEDDGDVAKGYYVEVKPADGQAWERCHTAPLSMSSYTIKGLKSMAMYFVRVVASNNGGDGEPQELDNYVLAMPPPVRPHFLIDSKFKSFIVVKAGNTVRVNMNFEASPIPEIVWLKDGIPVSKRATITNSDGVSQLLIPSSERSDSGIYTINVKNCIGQESFSVEIRVTDEPKPPGPVQLEENVSGTVTVSWEPSPDEKRDNRLHYMVMTRDSSKLSWHTVADDIFNNKFTAINIVAGRSYYFRVYAKNDMGLSAPSESSAWEIGKKKDKLTVNVPRYKEKDHRQAPYFIVPLKTHFVPRGYECHMSCAVRGTPKPHVTWYHNNISLNHNAHYLVSNVHGVWSLFIIGVSPRDSGDYTVVAENSLGRAECSTRLTVRE